MKKLGFLVSSFSKHILQPRACFKEDRILRAPKVAPTLTKTNLISKVEEGCFS